jgi:hypothetical protein
MAGLRWDGTERSRVPRELSEAVADALEEPEQDAGWLTLQEVIG